MVKIHNNNPTIHVSDLIDGQLAIITDWFHKDYIDTVVQKYGNDQLIVIGGKHTLSWTKIHEVTKQSHPECQVKVLNKGTLIEVI